MVKVLFVDVDGTLTETESGHTFKQHPQDVKIIDGADKAIAYFHSQGWRIIGISNQGGCGSINPLTGKPFKSIEDAIAEMNFTLSLFSESIESILFCPDMIGEDCWCVDSTSAFEIGTQEPDLIGSYRKPNPGMIYLVLEGFADEEVDVEEVCMIGDRPEDEQAAINAGINFCPADMWRDRFRKGTFAHAATPEQIKFLEGIGITATGW